MKSDFAMLWIISITLVSGCFNKEEAPSGKSTVGSRATQLVLTGSPTASAGVCTGPFQLSSLDASNKEILAASDLSLSLSGLGGAKIFSDSKCSAPLTLVVIAKGKASASFFLRDNAYENLSIMAEKSGLKRATLSLLVKDGGPVKSVLSSAQDLLVAGSCIPLTLKLLNAADLSSNALTPLTFNISGLGTGQLFTDMNCSLALTNNQATLNSGANSISLYFRDTKAEEITLSAAESTAKVTAASLSKSVIAAAPSQLILMGAALNTAGACVPYTLKTQDTFNNESKVTLTTPIAFGPSGSNLFYSTNNCQTAISSITLPIGSSTATFYARDTLAEVFSLIVDDGANGLIGATQAVTVNPAPATKLVMAGPASLSANQCSLAFSVVIQDMFNNLSNVQAATLVTLAGQGMGTFYSDSLCNTASNTLNFPLGSNSREFYFKSTKSESLTLNADDGAAGLTAGTSALSILALSPTQLVFIGVTTSTAGTCIPYMIKSQDPFNNDSAVSATLTLSFGPSGSGLFHSSSNCSTPISTLSLANNTSQVAVYFRDTLSENVTLSASPAPTGLTAASLSLSITPGPPAKLFLLGETSLLPSACGSYRVNVGDAFDNISNVAINTPVALSGMGMGLYYSDSNCTAVITSTVVGANQNTRTFFFKDNFTENLTLMASSAGLIASSLTVVVLQPAVLSISDGTAGTSTDYGSQYVGSTRLVTMTLTNSGGATASAIAANLPQSYRLGPGSTCQTTLAGGNSCTFGVVFEPVSAQSYVGALNINYNNGRTTQTTNRALSGSGFLNTSLEPQFDSSGRNTSISSSLGEYVEVPPQRHVRFSDNSSVRVGYLHNGLSYDFSYVYRAATTSSKIDFSGREDFATAIEMQGDQKVVVGGYSKGASSTQFALARIGTDGLLDTSFGSGGMVLTAIGNVRDIATAIAVQPIDQKILLAGYTFNGNNYDFAIVRYNTDGSLDNTFGNNGKVVTPVGPGNDQAFGILQLTLGGSAAILLVGRAYYINSYDFALVMINGGDGSLRTSFNGSGKLVTDFSGGHDTAHYVGLANGLLYVSGRSFNGTHHDCAIASYRGNGSLDPVLGGTGKLLADFGSLDSATSTWSPGTQDMPWGFTAFSNAIRVGASVSDGTRVGFGWISFNLDGTVLTPFQANITIGEPFNVVGSYFIDSQARETGITFLDPADLFVNYLTLTLGY